MDALDGAERKGREAAAAGKGSSSCPYKDRRTSRGSVTWSRAFITAWHKGFNERRLQTQLPAEGPRNG